MLEILQKIRKRLKPPAAAPPGRQSIIKEAKQAVEDKKWSRALDLSRVGLAQHPNCFDLKNIQAQALLKTNQFEASKQSYQYLASKYPKRPNGLTGLARLALRKEEWSLALKLCSKLVSRFPAVPLHTIFLSRILMELEQFDQAGRVLEKAASRWPGHPGIITQSARLAYRIGDWTKALSYWEQIPSELSPKCLLEKGLALFEAARYREAETIFTGLVVDHSFIPAYGELFRMLQLCYRGKTRILRSIELLDNLSHAHGTDCSDLKCRLEAQLETEDDTEPGTLSEPSNGNLPDFLIIGAAKSGTTSLWRHLDGHPRIEMSSRFLGVFIKNNEINTKEVAFFNHSWERGVNWYRSLFSDNDFLHGEGTPFYINFYPAHERMARVLPHARLILSLRNPVTRAYSAYNQSKQIGTAWCDPQLSFMENIQREIDSHFTSGKLLNQGFYMDHIEHLLKYYPREQLLIVIAEQMKTDPLSTYQTVFDFLGLEDHAVSYDKNINSRPYSHPLPEKAAAQLYDLYGPCNERLFDFLGYRIPEWEKD